MSQFFAFESCRAKYGRKTCLKKGKKKSRETDQYLNLFEKNPTLKVPTMAEFKEYPCPNTGPLSWESMIHFRNLCLSLKDFEKLKFCLFPP